MSIRRSNLEQEYVRVFERAHPMEKSDQDFIDLASNDTLAEEIRKMGKGVWPPPTPDYVHFQPEIFEAAKDVDLLGVFREDIPGGDVTQLRKIEHLFKCLKDVGVEEFYLSQLREALREGTNLGTSVNHAAGTLREKPTPKEMSVVLRLCSIPQHPPGPGFEYQSCLFDYEGPLTICAREMEKTHQLGREK